MTIPNIDELMPFGVTLHPHTTGNYLKIDNTDVELQAPKGVITVQVTWEGSENLYLWARRDGNSIQVVASDLTGRGQITAQIGSLSSCELRVSADNHTAGSSTRRGTLQVIPIPARQ